MNHPSEKAPWVIRSFEQGDEPGISDLFQIVFGRRVSSAYWRWKLHSLPANAENEWVAESGGRIVGHYAVTPIPFKLHDRQALIPHGCDAMTHPKYRRQGIMTALGQRANEVWARSGSPFQIGFHFGGWGSVREGLGWQPIVRLAWMKLWIRPFAGVARRFHLPCPWIWKSADSLFFRFPTTGKQSVHGDSAGSGIQLERILQADNRFDRLWNNLSPGYDILAVRDRPWVQWRCLDRPGAEQRLYLAMRAHEPVGYIALRITRTESAVRATILDCLVAPGDAMTANALLLHVMAEAADSGARSLAALCTPESLLADQFRAAGFRASRHGYDFSLISYSPSKPSPTAAGWFLTGAEGDVL